LLHLVGCLHRCTKMTHRHTNIEIQYTYVHFRFIFTEGAKFLRPSVRKASLLLQICRFTFLERILNNLHLHYSMLTDRRYKSVSCNERLIHSKLVQQSVHCTERGISK